MRRLQKGLGLTLIAALAATPSAAFAGTLAGSHASMVRQHAAAVDLDYTFVKNPAQLEKLADLGSLERVEPNRDFALSNVSYPFARADVHFFIQMLAAQYHDSVGSRLVVTSLTRPTSLQPRNASPLSVHPAGMAVDLRVPADGAARTWLERTLLALENDGVIDVTREHSPSHFHVAVFPEALRTYAIAHDWAGYLARRVVPEPPTSLESFLATPTASTGLGDALALFGLVGIGCLFAALGARSWRVVRALS